MYDVTDDIKNAYKSAETIKASAEFISLGMTLSKEIMGESPKLIESIMNGTDLSFGACVASQLDFTVKDVSKNINGQEFIYSHTVNGKPVQIGIYKVENSPAKDNGVKEVTAYDRMKKIDVDVAAWYNGLFPLGSETYTLADFRASLLKYIGLEEDVSNLPLPNDNMKVKKTIDPSGISGRKVIEACEALNGAFGHMNRYGKFAHIILKPTYALYSLKGQYPSATLYTFAGNDTSGNSISAETLTRSMYRQNGVKLEDHVVKEFDKLIIRSDENDVGAIAGTGSNAYIIEDNFLVYGKSAAELQIIAQNAFGNINKRPYRPYESDNIGLPYIEVGDAVKLETDNPVVSYVLNRTLTGIQALKDAFSADGSEEVKQNFSVREEIIQIKNRSAKIEKSVDAVKVTMEDTAEDLYAAMEMSAGKINWIVEQGGDASSFTLTPRMLRLVSGDIDLTGYVTFHSLKTEGETTINGSNITSGILMSYNYLQRNQDGSLFYDPQGKTVETAIGSLLNLNTGYAKFSGKFTYAWLDDVSDIHTAYVELKEGLARFRDDDKDRSLYVTPNGIATTIDANEASGVIDFFSNIYKDTYRGITVQTKSSPVALRSLQNAIFLNPEVDVADDNLFCLDVSDVITDGRIRYGKGEIVDGARTFATGLRFSADPDNPYIIVTKGDGSRSSLAPIFASNLPGAIVSVDITDNTFSITTENGTLEYSLTKDASGRIKKIVDNGSNVVTINYQ